MNKKVTSEIAVGVILLITIVVGGVFWMQNKKEIPNDVVQVVTPVVRNNEELKAEIKIPDTFQILTSDETKNWRTYANKKYGYSLKYPEGLKCAVDESGAGMVGDMEDVFTCDSSGKDRLFIFIQPQVITPNQSKVTFSTMQETVTIDVKNKNIINSISESIRGADDSFAKHEFLKDLAPLNTDNFKPFSGVEKIIGFAYMNVSNAHFVGGEKIVHKYGRNWYFVKDNVLFQMYTSYDDAWPTADNTEENFKNKIQQDVPNLERIFSTLVFSKAEEKHADLNPKK